MTLARLGCGVEVVLRVARQVGQDVFPDNIRRGDHGLNAPSSALTCEESPKSGIEEHLAEDPRDDPRLIDVRLV